MLSYKHFFVVFITSFLLLSLPNIFGVGYAISFHPDATLFQKVKAYLVTGLTYGFLVKLTISAALGLVAGIKRKK